MCRLAIPIFQIALLLPVWADGTFLLVLSLILVNLLVLLEVAERLSLKGELEVAREIQLALLPRGTYTTGDIEVSGFTKPANTVGGDFYDVLPQADGRIVLTLGDVAGKGSPAALLMALLLAALRTLVEERMEPAALVARLNIQICRHSPASRFITLVYALYEPATGRLTYVNAGQNPPLIRRRNGRFDRLHGTGIALGLFEHSEYAAAETTLEPGDLLVFYSDGITEAEDPVGPAARGKWPRARRSNGTPTSRHPQSGRGAGGCAGPRPPRSFRRRPDDPGGEAGGVMLASSALAARNTSSTSPLSSLSARSADASSNSSQFSSLGSLTGPVGV